MTKKEVSNGRTNKISKFIYNVRDDIPNLELNEDKTEHFFYGNGKIRKLKGQSNLVNYLGFTFDGKSVRIRDKSLFKFYCRAYRKIKKVNETEDEKSFNAGKRRFIVHIHIWVPIKILKVMETFLVMSIRQMIYLVRVSYLKVI